MGSLIARVVTLGCKVNQCESAAIVSALRSRNISASEGLDPADVYILNTCSVTAEADRKSRQYLSKMRKLNPDCKIIVVGCSSQNNADVFRKENVIAVGGTGKKTEFVLNALNCADRIASPSFEKKCDNLKETEVKNEKSSAKTRSFIKIQDGCNRFCSYCIIPYLRGRSRSKPISSILDECYSVSSKEIVLTGIDISMYGLDIGASLAELLSALKGVGARIRLGSLECEAVTPELLGAMKNAGCCDHFHLSLQSGCNEVLKSMNRHYDTDYYYDKIRLIRDFYPKAGITTDIIAGFPTETDEDFEKSCEFIEKCAFSDIHVFPYSTRKGTLASKKYTDIDSNIMNKRVEKLLDIKRNSKKKFISSMIGETQCVYVEDSERGYNVGYTPNYVKVYSHAPQGSLSMIKLSEPFADGIIGDLVR